VRSSTQLELPLWEPGLRAMTTVLLHAFAVASAMGWEILWPLILGFALSAVVQAVVSHREMSRLMPDDRPRSIAVALLLGAASSSCSYAAVALARSIFLKGANFTAAMAFELASTNLIAELSIIMLVLLGWQITVAEFIGAPIMVAILVLLFRRFLSPRLLEEAKEQAERRTLAALSTSHSVPFCEDASPSTVMPFRADPSPMSKPTILRHVGRSRDVSPGAPMYNFQTGGF
jgi:uncharacterized membrane protein YraQ (UPF0718 family)